MEAPYVVWDCAPGHTQVSRWQGCAFCFADCILLSPRELLIGAQEAGKIESLILVVLKALYNLDFVSWCGRLLLMPVFWWASTGTNDPSQNRYLQLFNSLDRATSA